MRGESCMRIIATGIQNRHDRTASRVADVTAVEDTRIVNVNGVLYCSSRLVGVGNDHTFDSLYVADLPDLLIGGLDECTVKRVVIVILDLSD